MNGWVNWTLLSFCRQACSSHHQIVIWFVKLKKMKTNTDTAMLSKFLMKLFWSSRDGVQDNIIPCRDHQYRRRTFLAAVSFIAAPSNTLAAAKCKRYLKPANKENYKIPKSFFCFCFCVCGATINCRHRHPLVCSQAPERVFCLAPKNIFLLLG